MILKDKFYTINAINEADKMLQAEITIDPKHEVFAGHFPDNPVTPGVVQMEIIKELLTVHFNRPFQLKTMGNCKFLAILNPNETPDVLVKITLVPTETGTLKISGAISSDATTFLKIQAEYC